jgi:hypothetical protein
MFVYKPYMIKRMGQIKKELDEEQKEYEKRLITYSNLKKRRENGEIIKPVNNYFIVK